MIRKLIHNRTKSANLICEQCFNKENLLFESKEKIIKQNINENNFSSFFDFQDRIEQTNKNRIMQRVFNREQLSRSLSHSSLPLITSRNKSIDKDNNKYALNYQSLLTLDLSNQKKDNDFYFKQNMIKYNQELMKQKTKVIVEQSYKQSIWRTQMKEVHNANREVIINKINSSRNQNKINRDNKEIKDSINVTINSDKTLKTKLSNIKGGLNEELKRNIKEEIYITCSHGQKMEKCSICNKLVPRKTMKVNIFINAIQV